MELLTFSAVSLSPHDPISSEMVNVKKRAARITENYDFILEDIDERDEHISDMTKDLFRLLSLTITGHYPLGEVPVEPRATTKSESEPIPEWFQKKTEEAEFRSSPGQYVDEHLRFVKQSNAYARESAVSFRRGLEAISRYSKRLQVKILKSKPSFARRCRLARIYMGLSVATLCYSIIVTELVALSNVLAGDVGRAYRLCLLKYYC